MKKIILGIVIGLLAGATIAWILLRHSREKGGEAHAEEHQEESRVRHGTNGEILIKLDKATQERIALKTAPLESTQLPLEIKGYGRVIDPAPLAALLVEELFAQASLEASAKDYQRLKGLYAQDQNVSTRALENAEAAMKKDQILVEAAKGKLALMLGQTPIAQSDLQEFVASLIALKSALVRIDLFLGEAPQKPPQGGRVAAVGAEEHPLPAEFLGPAPNADPQTKGQGFLFALKTNSLPAGSAVIGWLRIPGEAQRGLIAPRAALLRHEGEIFVYVQIDEETFRRSKITLDRPVENGWFLRTGLSPNDKVVIVGGQQLLSEEMKSENAE